MTENNITVSLSKLIKTKKDVQNLMSKHPELETNLQKVIDAIDSDILAGLEKNNKPEGVESYKAIMRLEKQQKK